eukprot:GHVR01091188.1.p1 GENE.GHVR01091188.1~~GHVR01091188.1.p1  ORF type:complete len:222 (+),score=62.87 GHVR01091188.1:527-1192(+)
MIVMAPSDQIELSRMVATAHILNTHPSIIRYPRGNGFTQSDLINLLNHTETEIQEDAYTPVPVGRARVVYTGRKHAERRLAMIALGTSVYTCVKAALQFEDTHPSFSLLVVDARFMKPLDTILINSIASQYEAIVTIEEGVKGGFGSHVLDHLNKEGYLHGNNGIKVKCMYAPDVFIEHMSVEEQLKEASLSQEDVINVLQQLASTDNNLGLKIQNTAAEI